MFAVLSDTHSHTGHELAGAVRDAVADADAVLHAGDFTTEAALDAFHDAAERLHAVHGNSDTEAVRERLPAARTVDLAGVRVALTHRRRGGPTGLAMFGRERGADLVVSGHTHRPSVTETEHCTLLNPGSHAEPRGNPASHAVLTPDAGGLAGEIRDREGDRLESFRVEGRN
ncbi:putative phosphoesterase [Halarchaeum rubridurum]|uniref:Phosphoesterase n=1 Tax=Halarchaeum rubridurum TaxID=489911 RepID=A0A830G558_9EURY|nr:metallophosphoesterase [Halarchaeum rubridurum]MBP1955750.1 putative phosphoesterase [Halarchaeum rubridurum]GGM74831.1 phosphodiesterase [Halarchaeum rubridurum]